MERELIRRRRNEGITPSLRLLLTVAVIGALGFVLAACSSPMSDDPAVDDSPSDDAPADDGAGADSTAPTDIVRININFDNPEEPTIAFTGVQSGDVEEHQGLTVEASAAFSSYEWLIDGTSSAAVSVSGPTDNTAEIDTGELGLGTRTLTLIVDSMYSAQTRFTVVQP